MMTTRTSDTHTHKQAHKTHSQLAATHPEWAYTSLRATPPLSPPQAHTNGAKGSNNSTQTQTGDREQRVRLVRLELSSLGKEKKGFNITK